MARYKNEKLLKALGERIKARRIQAELEIEDLAAMTGFTYNTISNIENGLETYISYFIQICFAIGIHPKEILDIELEIKPRYALTPDRQEKSRLTKRIKTYIQKDYFKEERSTREVTEKLNADYKLNFLSKNVSVILNRLTKENTLKVIKKEGKNFYTKK
ncbi:helix-turn-helix domain-containing protein [Flavobacterium sp. 17A]|uniref:Helix-turn-helix domain-containing protein n=1 Tax=Flavobacterium potami TaxID=2872310 RepID=A0A9X1KRM1_9FLAO|nr:XRE family transcriptional regulator [Flavobacterium potami]MBZ4036700.1 helix-turn-helix domain-containing protein [Flavobacterium potami]